MAAVVELKVPSGCKGNEFLLMSEYASLPCPNFHVRRPDRLRNDVLIFVEHRLMIGPSVGLQATTTPRLGSITLHVYVPVDAHRKSASGENFVPRR